MINEILIEDEVEREGMLDDSASVKHLREIRTQTILMGYAQRISIDTMHVTEEEVQQEFRRYTTKVNARYLYAQTEDEAWKLKDELERGATFESLAKEIFQDPGLANNGGSLGTFGWGEMEPALEDAAYTLPIGSLSDPVKMRIGYAIIKVEDRFTNPLASESDYANVKDKLGGAVEKHKLVNILKTTTDCIRKDLDPSIHEEALKKLSDILLSSRPVTSVGTHVESEVQNISSMPLVSFRQGTWTVGDFMERIKQTTDRQQKRVRTQDELREFIVGLAVREVTLKRAEEAGIEKDSVVRQQIAKQITQYVLTRWRGSVEDTVGEHGWDEAFLKNFYNEKQKEYIDPPEVDVGEILVRTKGEGEKFVRQLSRGADFSKLAREHSLRLWAAKNGGDLGFNQKSTYGIWGDTIFATDAGKILGPLFVDPYYGVFKILGKRSARIETYDEARPQVLHEIESLKKQDALKAAVQNIRRGKDIVINNDLLSNTEVNSSIQR